MKLLLDTHIYLWLRSGDPRLAEGFLAAIVDEANIKYVSSISLAEIVIKISIGKLSAAAEPALDLSAGFDPLAFEPAHAQTLASLPLLHRDPFDRMLVAQALTDELVFLTADPRCLAYGVKELHQDRE